MGRSARNKSNIKIRQPLAELAISANEDIIKVAKDNQDEILEELNIKSLNLVKDESALVNFIIKPNFQLLGKKFGDSMSQVSQLINEMDSKYLFTKIKANKNIELNYQNENYVIFPEEFIIKEVAEKGYGISYAKDIVVGISTEISDELRQEGMVRDLIRQIQNLRKDSGLKVEDRIEIGIMGSHDLQDAVILHETYFMTEVLGVKLKLEDANSLIYNQSVKINGKSITIGISPIY
jgi:isoleucyl-tRNA synthetase